ncbi:sigma 54-interacting transcriptional regulator [Sorangium sp. So ce406]|uniref:sigma 54-interacting transcriptional regulator n=1 Tax=Sorangium sp. So ce406 TaxID=3133311 RepID=UPI003F5BFC1E
MKKRGLLEVSTVDGPRHRAVERPPSTLPALTVVSHPSPGRVGDRLLLEALAAGKDVLLSRNAPTFARPGSAVGSPLADPSLSRRPLRLAPAGDGRVRVCLDDGGTRVTVAGEPVPAAWEIDLADLARGVPLELSDRVVVLLHLASAEPEGAMESMGMVGSGAGIRGVQRHVQRIADLNVPVLIRGETGVGKELVARAIHARSRRRDGPFVSVNLGAIPRELAAAELFGTQKGAFTGATRDREGFFRVARGGTLFLDELGEAPVDVQVMLLRVLETGEMYPVGGQTPVPTDVRLVAATDADLEALIREGRLRAPLLHRLAGYEIRIPPLRERREDIGALFYSFALEELEAIGEADRLAPADPYAEPWLPASLATCLVRFAWPGNIRQLRNVTRQLVIGSRGQPRLQAEPRLLEELSAGALPLPGRLHARPSGSVPAPAQGAPGDHAGAPTAGAPARRRPSEVTEPELSAALRANAWDLKAAADQLGIPRPSIYDLIERSTSIRTAGDLGAEEIERCFRACGGDLDRMVEQLSVSKRALRRRLKELRLEPGRH